MPSVALRVKTISRVDAGVEERADALARRLVGVGRALAQHVHAAMDVGVVVAVVARDRVDHRLRLLRRRRVVEIDERLAVDRVGEGSGSRRGRAATSNVGAGAATAARAGCSPRARSSCRVHFRQIAARAARTARLRAPRAAARSGRRSSTCAGERVDQHVARLGVGQAARAQVEDRVVVELADRRAVRALHVVGEDLELRLGVDRRVVGEQQRPVRLLGVGLLRVLADDDLAVEDRARRAAEDALVDLVAARSAAWRDRSSCGCRRAARRRRGTGRSACSRRLRRRGWRRRRCGRARRRARTSATRTSRCARRARAGWRRGTRRATPAAPCSDRRRRSRRRTTSVTALVK